MKAVNHQEENSTEIGVIMDSKILLQSVASSFCVHVKRAGNMCHRNSLKPSIPKFFNPSKSLPFLKPTTGTKTAHSHYLLPMNAVQHQIILLVYTHEP